MHGTSGSLTYWCLLDSLPGMVQLIPFPQGESASNILGGAMKIVYVCYAALGYAVARWIFQRQPMPVTDPVTRLRSSGLL
jgi:hypothetical protein